MPQPNKIPLAFAASGDKNIIPESTETTGLASWRDGFPAITSTPFSEGGIAPKRADFNGIFNALSQAVMWMQQGGVYVYDVTTNYEAGNVVLDAGGLYVANATNGPSSAVVQPSSDTTGATWKPVRLDVATQTAAGYMSAEDKAALDGVPMTYLPLSGGTLIGAVVFSGLGQIIKQADNAHQISILSGINGNSEQGAKVTLNGAGYSTDPGAFVLQAGYVGGYKQLLGKPDGTLTWDGNDIFTSGNSAISSSTATIPYSFKQKFANGFMIQAYYGKPSTDSNSRFQWTYPEAFIEDPFVSVSNAIPSQALNLYQWNKTRTIINVCNTTGAQAGSGVDIEIIIIAFGRWK